MTVSVVDVEALEWTAVVPSRAGTGNVRVKAFATGCDSIPAGQLVEYESSRIEVPHSHDEVEVFYVLDGEMTIDATVAGPGSVVVIEAGTTYGLASDRGCRYLRLRLGDPAHAAG
jgi:quercetin dioxygenase-like cupin family protein